jgi:tRNA(fMet)-specific endonuclease VapC
VALSRVLLDTSAYSAMRRGDLRLQPPLQEAAEVLMSPIVVGELLYGFKKGGREKKNIAELREFLAAPRVGLLTVDAETAERYALLQVHLQKAGTPVAANDLWIAASAAQYGLRLMTLDAHFTRMPQILVEYFAPA